MELLIGLFFLCAVWLTLLTMKMREQKAQNKALEKRANFYQKELTRISNEQEEAEKGQAEKA
jgi:hypothetical protein